jgi:hypothetical protein
MALQNNVWTTMKLGFVVLTVIVFGCWLWHPEPPQVPADLVGEWHTADPVYADRALVIDDSTINFETGNSKVSVGFIDTVKWVQIDNRILYTIKYSLNGASNNVSFYFEGGKDKTIRFKNQEHVIWTKDKNT